MYRLVPLKLCIIPVSKHVCLIVCACAVPRSIANDYRKQPHVCVRMCLLVRKAYLLIFKGYE